MRNGQCGLSSRGGSKGCKVDVPAMGATTPLDVVMLFASQLGQSNGANYMWYPFSVFIAASLNNQYYLSFHRVNG